MSEKIPVSADKFPVIAGLLKRYPKKSPLHSAITHLMKIDEIVNFATEYTNYLEQQEPLDLQEPPQVKSGRLIAYHLGYYDEATRKRWEDALPQMGSNQGLVSGQIAEGSSISEVLENKFKEMNKKK